MGQETAVEAATLLVRPGEEAADGVLPADEHLRLAVIPVGPGTPVLQRALLQRAVRQTPTVIEVVCFAVLRHSWKLMHLRVHPL